MLKAGGPAVGTHPMMAVAIAAQSAGRVGETGLRARVPLISVTLFPCQNPYPASSWFGPHWIGGPQQEKGIQSLDVGCKWRRGR